MTWAAHAIVSVPHHPNDWALPPVDGGVKSVWKAANRYHDARASCETLKRLLVLAAQNKTAAEG